MTENIEGSDLDFAENVMHALQQGGIITSLERQLYDGDQYMISEKLTGIASGGGTGNIFISNDSSNEYFSVSNISTSTGEASDTRIVKNVTVDTAGTTITASNKKSDESDSFSIATTESDVAYSGGDEIEVVFSPAAKDVSPASFDGTGNLLIAPGDNVVLEVENTSASNMDASLSIQGSTIPDAIVNNY